MLAICGFRDYVLFTDAAVTKRFSQSGCAPTSKGRPTLAPRLAGFCAARFSPALAPRVLWRRCARWPRLR
eukprot:5217823-Pleurochrysis_carterae.AAC.1